jgi:lantibiotic transport system ATP-binding protein
MGGVTSVSEPAHLDPRQSATNSIVAIQTQALSKRYGAVEAVRDLELRVERGRVYALLGPNGAGKSTALKLILGLLGPTSGAIALFGQAWRRDLLAYVGASIEGPALYAHLSAAENLEIHARLLGLPGDSIGAALAKVGLQGVGRKPVARFSTGMQGRLALAQALLTDPDLLILDEPQNGLDPEGILELRTLVRTLAAQGKAVLISSHLLAEVAQLADDIGVIARGVLRYQGPLSGLANDGTSLEDAYLALVRGRHEEAA